MVDIDIRDLRKQCIQSLISTAENVAKYLQEDKEDNYEKLKMYMENYCLLEIEQEVAEQALEAAKADTNISNINTLQKRFEDGLKTLSQNRINPNSHRYMQELKTRYESGLQSVSSSGLTENLNESDIAIVQTNEQFLDPITKKHISDPVKNTMCGHVYERETILNLIRRKHRIRCPVAGCANPESIQENHLLEDEELRFRLSLSQHSTMIH